VLRAEVLQRIAQNREIGDFVTDGDTA
jgi:hypothetical protein